MFEQGPVHVPSELKMAASVLFIAWFVLFAATITCGRLTSLSRVLPVAFIWFIISMLQLGVTPHIASSTTGPAIVMAIFAAIGYALTTFRLRAKHLTVRAQDALVPFRAPTAEVSEPEGRLAATRK